MIEISVEIGQTSKTLIIDILRPNVTRAHLVTYTAGATNNKKLSKKKVDPRYDSETDQRKLDSSSIFFASRECRSERLCLPFRGVKFCIFSLKIFQRWPSSNFENVEKSEIGENFLNLFTGRC